MGWTYASTLLAATADLFFISELTIKRIRKKKHEDRRLHVNLTIL